MHRLWHLLLGQVKAAPQPPHNPTSLFTVSPTFLPLLEGHRSCFVSIYLFIYLAVLGPGCDPRDLPSSLWHARSLSCHTCGI